MKSCPDRICYHPDRASGYTIGGRRDVWQRTFHPDVSHPELFSAAIPSGYFTVDITSGYFSVDISPGCLTSGILLRWHFTRMYHIRNSAAEWERRAFQLPRSHISGSSDSTYPENFAAILHSVAVFSWSFPIFATDILRYFALNIWCLNPQSLLVTHLS